MHYVLVMNEELDGGERILAFGSQDGVAMLKNTSKWSADGTFGSCPSPFYQLYVICAQVDDHSVIPALFCFLPNKNMATCDIIFNKLVNLCGIPEEITVDFEKAVHQSLLKIDKNIKINGCLFHFQQAILRQVKLIFSILGYTQITDISFRSG